MFEEFANALLLEWLFQRERQIQGRYRYAPDTPLVRRIFILRLQTLNYQGLEAMRAVEDVFVLGEYRQP